MGLIERMYGVRTATSKATATETFSSAFCEKKAAKKLLY